MMMKRLLLFILVLVTTVAGVQAAEYYEAFEFSFSDGTPNSVYVTGGECEDQSCSSLGKDVTIYRGAAADQCFSANSLEQFRNCMQQYQVNDGVVNTDGVVVKQDIPSNFGYNTYFFTSQDAYLPEFFRTTNYNCDFDVCVSSNPKEISFEKRPNAIAEIQQLNVKNTENDQLPIQVEVPVEIEETVCSAFEFTEPGMFTPDMPSGYADYAADTRVDLTITQQSNNQELYSDAIEIPITADECRKMQTFSWTPPSSLENEEIKFRASSFVTDNQVSSSQRDFSEVVETIYPQDLSDACYTRAYDFTLSNEPGTDLSTSIAEITQGETLYASFRAQAFKGENAEQPIDYRATILFEGEQVFSQRFTSQNDLTTHTVDLSDETSSLATGSYEVKLITTPLASNCRISEDVEQTQNLHIRAPERFDVTFHVSDADGEALENSRVDLTLEEAADHLIDEPSFDASQMTNTEGETVFQDVIKGEYAYEVSKEGFNTVSNTLTVEGNRDVYVTLQQDNVAPIVALPDQFTGQVGEEIIIDLSEYITDGDHRFADLSISSQVVEGDVSLSREDEQLIVTTDSAQEASVQVRAEDPEGARGQDTTTVVFTANEAPQITTFAADPDEGEVPLTSTFSVGVSDPENDALTCTLQYGDGTMVEEDCGALDGISHRYDETGTFTAELTVSDGTSETRANVPIEVFERVAPNDGPQVQSFTLDSSNGAFVPTDLSLNWEVTHPQDLPTQCTLLVNNQSESVDCSGSLEIDDYDRIGTGSFTIRAEDNDGKSDSETITRTFQESDGPQVQSFTLDSSNGAFVPTDLSLNWEVTHPQDLPTQCTLVVNDQSEPVDCSGSLEIDDYDRIGTGSFTIRAEDSNDKTDEETITRTFQESDGPQVQSFTLDSSNGRFVPTDLSLNWEVTHPQDLETECFLTINGGSSEVPCDGSRTLTNYNLEGQGTFTIEARDENGKRDAETITRTFERNEGPIVSRFDVDSSNGRFVPTDLTIAWEAEHLQGLDISCELVINGAAETVPCVGEQTIEDYNRSGPATFALQVEDEQGQNAQEVITRSFVRNDGPDIEEFTLQSSNGDLLPTDLSLNWEASHPQGLDISCFLTVNGQTNPVRCQDSGQILNYTREGTGTFTFSVEDSQGMRDSATLTRDFEANKGPEIETFDVTSSNGPYIPTNLTIDWEVTHPQNLTTTCSLTVNDNTTTVPCEDSLTIEDYDHLGVGYFTIKGEDSQGVAVEETITKTFRNPPVRLENLSAELLIDEEINPGTFRFQIAINDKENVPYRFVEIDPVIICEGATNRLKEGPLTDDSTAFVSREGGPVSTFTFKLDTLDDFKNQIPKDRACTFRVTLEDEFGDELVLSDTVTFRYATEDQGPEASIRGRGTDVLNYMTTALSGRIERGYNSVRFNVDNIDDEGKELRISLMSRELGVSQAITVKLDAGEEEMVQVPVFIREQTDAGRYSLRIGVSDDEEKHVRYSYLQVPAQE